VVLEGLDGCATRQASSRSSYDVDRRDVVIRRVEKTVAMRVDLRSSDDVAASGITFFLYCPAFTSIAEERATSTPCVQKIHS